VAVVLIVVTRVPPPVVTPTVGLLRLTDVQLRELGFFPEHHVI